VNTSSEKKGARNKGFKFKLNFCGIPFGLPFDAGIEFEKWDVNQSEESATNSKRLEKWDNVNI
jgi:hypothetical protein